MLSVPPSRRRALRRAVRFDCQVQSELWDGQVPFLATDLSPLGMWLDSALPLQPGDRVMLAFRPPAWPDARPALRTEARVARSGLCRRRADAPQRSGMGLCFAGLDDIARAAVAESLRGLPPPLPGAVAPPLRLSRPRLSRPALAESGDPESEELVLVLDDGMRIELRAEAALLSAPRPGPAPPPTRARPHRPSFRHVPRKRVGNRHDDYRVR